MEEILNPGFDCVESVKSIGFDAFFFKIYLPNTPVLE